MTHFSAMVCVYAWTLVFLNEGYALTYDRDRVKSAMEKAALVAEIEIEQIEKTQNEKYGVLFRASSRLLHIRRVTKSQERLRGGDVVTITGIGGELAETGVYLTGFPRPIRGKKYLAYLNPTAPGTSEYRVVGFENGLKPLTTEKSERAFTRNRTDGSNGDGTGPFLYWDDTFFPIPYYFSAPSFVTVPDFLTAADASLNTWRKVEGTRFEFIPMGCTNNISGGNDGLNQIIYLTKDWDLDPLAIAVTRNYYISGNSARTGLVMDSDILLNGQFYVFSTDKTANTHDVQNILTHESGHLLGLGHEIEPLDTDATMYAWASPNEFNKRTLHTTDLAGIRAAYPGTGNRFPGNLSTTTCSLGKGGSCLAVHDSPPPRPQGWAAVILTVLSMLGLGRCYRRHLTASI